MEGVDSGPEGVDSGREGVDSEPEGVDLGLEGVNSGPEAPYGLTVTAPQRCLPLLPVACFVSCG
jgi:hypothetical protein